MRLGTSVSLPLETIVWLKNRPERVSDLIEHALEQVYCMSTVILAIENHDIYFPIEAHLKGSHIPFINLYTLDMDDAQYSYVSMVNACKYIIFYLTNDNGGLQILSKLETVAPEKILILAHNVSEQQIVELSHKQYQWFYSMDDITYFLRTKISLPKGKF